MWFLEGFPDLIIQSKQVNYEIEISLHQIGAVEVLEGVFFRTTGWLASSGMGRKWPKDSVSISAYVTMKKGQNFSLTSDICSGEGVERWEDRERRKSRPYLGTGLTSEPAGYSLLN